MKNFFKRNGLTIVLIGFFLIFELGMSFTGQRQKNQERMDLGLSGLGYFQYVSSGAFLEATMENWESEFLQMAAYVLFTCFLFQKGSAESKKMDEPEEVDRDPRETPIATDTPWPVRKGGFILRVYENSLSIALLVLFLLSFALHAIGGAEEYSEQELAHGRQAVTALEYIGTAQFWFESLQNWQSEFLSIGVLAILSIWLRQRGSPESKPGDSPHGLTGRG